MNGLVLCAPAGLQVPADYLLRLFVLGVPAVEAAPAHRVAAAAHGSFHPALADPGTLARAARVRCPTTILHGAADTLIPPAHARAYAAAIPGARLDVLPGVGHLVALEAPRRAWSWPSSTPGAEIGATYAGRRWRWSGACWSTRPRHLGPALEALADLDPVGIDVERADWKNYYRAAALVQVGGEGTVVLIDSLALPDLSALQDWLADRTVVLHAAENDLVPLAALGVAPTRLHDTAVAAALVGRPTGLETLLRDVLGIEPSADKQSMQRADWAARPLTDAMLDYAAGDVADLPRLATTLLAELDALGRQSWYAQELAAARALPSVEDRRDWTKLKGIGRLDPQVRAKARALWEWREELGRTTDTAPGRIIGDAVLVDLAANPPASVARARAPRHAPPGRPALRGAAAAGAGRGRQPAAGAGRAVGPAARRRGSGCSPTACVRCAPRPRPASASTPACSAPAAPCPARCCPTRARPRSCAPRSACATGSGSCCANPSPPRSSPTATPPRRWPTMAELLTPDQVADGLAALPAWDGDTSGIHRTVKRRDFVDAVAFVDAVVPVAEELNHHPDVAISWDTVTLTIVSHAAGGVTATCLELARRLDALA